jgi:hypothetical protein
MDRSNLIGSAVFLFIGLGLLSASGYAANSILAERQARLEREGWPVVEGTVTQVYAGRDQAGETSYRTTIEWTGPDGQRHEQISYPGRSCSLTEGQRLPMHYDPADPSRASREGGSEDWMVCLILAAMGLVFAGIAVRVTVDAWRRAH